MRGEERFAILGVLVLIFISASFLGGIKRDISYAPVDTSSTSFIEESDSFFSDSFEKIDNWLFSLSQDSNRNYIIYFLIGILFILFILIIIRLFKKKDTSISRKSDLLDRAIVTVNQLRNQGYNDLVIRQMFLEKGWSEEKINLIMI